MAFGGLKKLIRKNKGGIKKLAKLGAQYAISAALPVVGSKLATVGVGIVKRVASAPARRKAEKEREGKISKALAADIARPQLAMTASKETTAAAYGPGGQRVPGGGRPKTTAKFGPGGATVAQMARAATAQKGTPLGISSAVGSFIKKQIAEKKVSDRVKAAAAKKALAAEKKAAAKAERAAKAAAKKAAAAQKRAEKKGTAVQQIAASALGVKLGKSSAAKKIASNIKGKTLTAVKRSVRGSLKGSQAVPIAGATAGILAVGAKALDINAKAQIAKAEKKLKRKLTPAEAKSLTTPVNTFLGK